MDPDSGTRSIDARKVTVLVRGQKIASDLGIEVANVKLDVTEYDDDPEFFCDASGEASSGTPSFAFFAHKRFQSGDPTRELKLQVGLEIKYEEHATPFEFDQDITSMVTHPNFLIRWAGWAVHNFNLQHHPPNLDSLIGQNHVRVYGTPRSSSPTQAEFQLLIKGLHASDSRVTVLKFRHVDASHWYRSYSYAIWAETEISGLWIFFCEAGGVRQWWMVRRLRTDRATDPRPWAERGGQEL